MYRFDRQACDAREVAFEHAAQGDHLAQPGGIGDLAADDAGVIGGDGAAAGRRSAERYLRWALDDPVPDGTGPGD